MNNFVMNAARRGSRLVQIPSQALSLLNINFFSNHSEEIARYMIEKVISYAISRIFIKNSQMKRSNQAITKPTLTLVRLGIKRACIATKWQSQPL